MVRHLTFLQNVSSEAAVRLKEWLNLVELTLRTRVCLVDGKERKLRSYGIEVLWHFHVLATSLAGIDFGILVWPTFGS